MMRTLKRLIWLARTLEDGRALSAEEQDVVAFWFSGVVYGMAVGVIFTLVALK